MWATTNSIRFGIRLRHLQGEDESAALHTKVQLSPFGEFGQQLFGLFYGEGGLQSSSWGVISLLSSMTSSNCLWADSLRAPDYYHEQHNYPTAILSLIYAPRARVSTCHESVSFL